MSDDDARDTSTGEVDRIVDRGDSPDKHITAATQPLVDSVREKPTMQHQPSTFEENSNSRSNSNLFPVERTVRASVPTKERSNHQDLDETVS